MGLQWLRALKCLIFYLVPIGTPTFFFIGCAVLYCALEKTIFPSFSLSAALIAIEET
jgi:CBS-domain-containing membrane protein